MSTAAVGAPVTSNDSLNNDQDDKNDASNGPVAVASSDSEERHPNVIYEGDTVICEASDGRIFFQEIKRDGASIRAGKKMLSVAPVIGSSFGTIFEVQGNKLVQVTGGLFPDPVAPEVGEVGDVASDNRAYTDTNSAQKLSSSAIGELREQGATGEEIISQLVANSETWTAKTEFSKQKYLKKKQQKYMPRVRFLRSTADTLCRTYRIKNPGKILNLREDSLGQMLVYANIHATAQVLVADTTMGLVTGAIAERQAGNGRILAAYQGQQPAVDTLRRLNFDKKTLESIHFFQYKDLQLLSKREEDIVEEPSGPRDGLTPEQRKALQAERARHFTPEEQQKYAEKKERKKANKAVKQPSHVIRNWLRQPSDALVTATQFDPTALLERFLPLLGTSKPFVAYCEYLEPLTKAFKTLQAREDVIDLQLNETWTRAYQVLPGRTHPDMNMNACSGYLLSGIKIYIPSTETEVVKEDADEPATKKTKVEGNS